MSALSRYGIASVPRFAGPVSRDAGDFPIRRDLIEQFGQHRRIAGMAPGDLDCPDLQGLLIYP
ncbi:hypothetical protein RA20_04785 [Leisingera sp. ANG-Vp]|nr:hypothetical protein RA20_04785 [Leisingera sp. ANG-Vp]